MKRISMPLWLVLPLLGVWLPIATAAAQGTIPPKPVVSVPKPSSPSTKPVEAPKAKTGSDEKKDGSKGKAVPALPTGEPRLKRRPPVKPDGPAF